MRRSILIFFLTIVLLPSLIFPPRLIAGDNPRTITAVRTSIPPTIDGYLNDEVWKQAIPSGDFLQRDPDEGKPATEKTEIRVLYDNEALYFGCMMYDSEPDKIVHRLARRDDEVESDYISIRIDSFHDHQTAFEFTINASGTKVDILIYNDKRDEDPSWDVVWEVQTRLLPDGWSSEVKIPFRALRFSLQEKYIWGINFTRTINRKNERDYWALIRKSQSGFVSHFGHLVGLESIDPPLRLEVLPYAVGNAEFQQKSPGNSTGRTTKSNTGFDAKYGITSSLTLDLTVNPDFGQVEADPAVLNLSTFETFYPEKRQFFIEGSQIFNFTTFGSFGQQFGPGLFYSRRIGRALSGTAVAPLGGYVLEEPRAATILGAAKVTGKTENGLAVGILDATIQEEKTIVVDSVGNKLTQVVEPFANYGLVRLRKDVLENSNIGIILSSVSKRTRFPAFTGGIDWNLKFEQNTYGIDGFLAVSRATNDSSARIAGAAGRVTFRKDGGEHWLGNISFDFTSKNYFINDLGFFRRPNDFGSVGELRYKDDQPGKTVRRWFIAPTYHFRNNFDGARLFREFDVNGFLEFVNYWTLTSSAGYHPPVYDDRESRGHGLYLQPRKFSWSIEIETDSRQPIIGEMSEFYFYDVKGQRYWATELKTTLRPASWIDLRLGLGYGRTRNREGWVLNDINPSGSEVSVFATRDVDEYNLTLRGSITFTRDLTLQVYNQVFIAKGHYYDFRTLVSPTDFIIYPYAGNPDFNRKSLNLNVVLRWEYLPGSILFLVWNQSRRQDTGDFFTSFSQNFSDVFRIQPDNVFLIKLSYWWNP